MENKKCKNCNIIKPLDCYQLYYQNKKYYLRHKCITCFNYYNNAYHKKKYKNNLYYRDYKKDNAKKQKKEDKQEYSRKYYIKNRSKIKDKTREYQKTYTKNIYTKHRNNIRRRIKGYLQCKNISSITKDWLGCSPKELKIYIESKFKTGMNWDNYGYYGWHIDHITPLSSASTKDEFKKLIHYTNLQPLWAKDNLRKGAKILSNNK